MEDRRYSDGRLIFMQFEAGAWGHVAHTEQVRSTDHSSYCRERCFPAVDFPGSQREPADGGELRWGPRFKVYHPGRRSDRRVREFVCKVWRGH